MEGRPKRNCVSEKGKKLREEQDAQRSKKEARKRAKQELKDQPVNSSLRGRIWRSVNSLHQHSPAASGIHILEDAQRRARKKKIIEEEKDFCTDADIELARLAFPSPVDSAFCESRLQEYLSYMSRDKHDVLCCATCGLKTCTTESRIVAIDVFVQLYGVFCSKQIKIEFHCLHRLWLEYPQLKDLVLETRGVTEAGVRLCKKCDHCFKDNKSVPERFLSNNNYFGHVPDALKNLTFGEKLALGLGRSVLFHVKLYPAPCAQRAYLGHVISFEQPPERLLKELPLQPGEIVQSLRVVFVGPLVDKPKVIANLLHVRPNVLLQALTWLKSNNVLMKDITIKEEWIEMFPSFEEEILQLSVETPTAKEYDGYFERLDPSDGQHVENFDEPVLIGVEFAGTVAPDGSSVTVHDQQAAAALFGPRKIANTLDVVHRPDPTPMSEFTPSSTLIRLFPCLFPYGVGAVEDSRSVEITYKTWIKRCLHSFDTRFEKHEQFLFVIHNMQLRKSILSRARFLVEKSFFDANAESLGDPDKVQLSVKLALALEQRDGVAATSLENQGADRSLASRFLKRLQLISVGAPGSFFSRKRNGHEMRAAGVFLGMPTLFVTLNFADTHSPLVLLRACKITDFNARSASDLPTSYERTQIVSEHPIAVAEAFHRVIFGVLHFLFGWSEKAHKPLKGGGIFGILSWYYFVLETQMRGSLHAHGLVRLEGCPEIDILKTKLKDAQWAQKFCDMVNSFISCKIPFDIGSQWESFSPPNDLKQDYQNQDPSTAHPSSKRSFVPGSDNWIRFADMDLYDMLRKMSIHSHTFTCYKKSCSFCRFFFPKKRTQETRVTSTGCIIVERNHPWINAYNRYIAFALRSNHDVRLIGTGAAAYRSVKYCESYATKMPDELVKMWKHVDESLSKPRLRDDVASKPDVVEKARLLSIKILNALTGTVHVSGALAATKMLDLPDHYKSHSFVSLYVQQFRKFLLENHELEKEFSTQDDILQLDLDGNYHIDDKTEKNQCSTYRHRPDELEHMCVYQFFSLFAKKKLASSSERTMNLRQDHVQHETFKLKKYKCPRIPVLNGECFARNPIDDDTTAKKERYGFLMLMLFKPWRLCKDLLGIHQTFWRSYQDWRPSADERVATWIRNANAYFITEDDDMDESELDSTIDDTTFAKIAQQMPKAPPSLDDAITGTANDDEEDYGLSLEVQKIVLYAHKSKLFNKTATRSSMQHHTTLLKTTEANTVLWKKHDIVKKQPLELAPSPMSVPQNPRVSLLSHPNTRSQSVQLVPPNFSPTEICNGIIRKFALNDLQRAAFQRIVDHLDGTRPDQLGMFVTGPAGTGKSQILRATRDYLAARGKSDDLRIVSYMGSAASLVEGQTISSAFSFGLGKYTPPDASKLAQLRHTWSSVKVLMIDEISTVGCSVMYRMHETLSRIFGPTNKFFGGLHVISFGDFHQCAPVADTALWKTSKICKKGQQVEEGRTIWTSFFTTVVELTQIMRQRDEHQWAEFLRRFRSNTCTEQDRQYLEDISLRVNNLSDPKWKAAITLTPKNAVRAAISERCAARDASIASVRLLQWTATYHKNGKQVPAKVSYHELSGQNCGPHTFAYAPDMPVMLLSNQICGKQSVAHGLSNGTTGKLLGLLLDPREPQIDNDSNDTTHTLTHVPLGAFVFVPHLDVQPLPDIPDEIAKACNNMTQSVIFVKARTSPMDKQTVQRRQLPLIPAYALTIHKAQGLSMTQCVLDTSTNLFGLVHNLVYVALSRVTSTDGLAFLGPSPSKWLNYPPHEDLLQEDHRLQKYQLKL